MQPLRPTAPWDREPILDLVRGIAVLGILLVNVQLMRGPDLYPALAGAAPEPGSGADRLVGFVIGWLASGKFISSFAILFGIGAAIVIDRARRAGRSPRRLLARRYGWLIVAGLVHMLLLFPGDILFTYGLTGMALLLFVDVRPRTAVAVALTLMGLYTLFAVGIATAEVVATSASGGDLGSGMLVDLLATRADAAVSARSGGGLSAVLAVHAWESLFVQSSQLFALPWILGLFLLGLAVTRAGWVADLAAHRGQLRWVAAVGLGVGLPLNLGIGLTGPLGFGGVVPDAGVSIAVFAGIGTSIGAPILACGYLAAATLVSLRVGTATALTATGRMALTAYLLQSLLAMLVFTGFQRYDELTVSSSLWVVAGIWAAVLVFCPLWSSRYRMGAVEWLWRWATYGSRSPLRRSAPGASTG